MGALRCKTPDSDSSLISCSFARARDDCCNTGNCQGEAKGDPSDSARLFRDASQAQVNPNSASHMLSLSRNHVCVHGKLVRRNHTFVSTRVYPGHSIIINQGQLAWIPGPKMCGNKLFTTHPRSGPLLTTLTNMGNSVSSCDGCSRSSRSSKTSNRDRKW